MRRFSLEDLEEMSERSVLFKAIKQEVSKRGHWRNKPRGKSIETQPEWNPVPPK